MTEGLFHLRKMLLVGCLAVATLLLTPFGDLDDGRLKPVDLYRGFNPPDVEGLPMREAFRTLRANGHEVLSYASPAQDHILGATMRLLL